MRSERVELGSAFVEQQRKRLERLHDQLLRREKDTEAEARDVEERSGDEPRDSGDEGNHMAQIEINHALHVAGDRQLADVERALEKISQGSYGLSDISGEAIPRERLEAVPEAICTLEEQQRHERGGS